MATFDAIVLGTGGVGSAALLHLARCGLRVLGLDRFPPGHDRGSSHGETRIIRTAYFEHADYVPLLRRSYELWGDLEATSRKTLFHRVGLLQAGPRDGAVISGVLGSARQHNLHVEEIAGDAQRRERFRGFHLPEELAVVYEADAGYLLVEQCVVAHAAAAVERGAIIHSGETVQSWSMEQDGVRVVTDRGEYSAARLIITAGAWASDLLADLGLPLRVVRKHLHWFATRAPWYGQREHCPAYLYELPHGVFYGFPEVHEAAVKVAEHSGGVAVPDPLSDPPAEDPTDGQRVAAFVRDYLPGVTQRVIRHARCFYTLSPDEHFIVDRHPAHANVAFAAGLSGHGFKFTPVLGEILADLAIDGKTSLPAEFLRLARLSRL